MNWQKLFASHILERGYDYYCDGAVENIEIGRDDIRVSSSTKWDMRMRFSVTLP